jgi:hypothetical protein
MARNSSTTARTKSAAPGNPTEPHTSASAGLAAFQSAPGLWFFNWKIWLEARRRLDLVLDPLQLRAREFWLLALAGPGNVSQHEIADLCGLDPSSLVAVLDSMTAYVTLSGGLTDERLKLDIAVI